MLTDSIELLDTGILDSIATLRLVAFLEETYDIHVEAHEMNGGNIGSLSAIANFVEAKQG
jgi:acyl carrier protein